MVEIKIVTMGKTAVQYLALNPEGHITKGNEYVKNISQNLDAHITASEN